MGVYVTHSSLFLFAVGALVGGWWGFKGYVQIPVGQTASEIQVRPAGVMDLGFAVRCDDFELHYYTDPSGRPTGRVKDYLSKLTVLEDGQEVLKKTIEVNDPLIYRGIYFYQSSYGEAEGTGAWLSVFGPRRNLVAFRARVERGGAIELEDGSRLVLRGLLANFRDLGPAVEVGVERPGEKGETSVVFQAPQGNNRRVGGYTVRLDSVETVKYTGLQVAKDPGVWIVWAGCILITLGCFVAFFASHRRVWARVSQEEKGVRVFLAGNASRNRISFERWFAELGEHAEETFEK